MAFGSVNVPGKLTAAEVGAAAVGHTHTAAQVGAAAASHGTHVTYSTAAPKIDGTAAVGTAATVARSDHVHPTDTSRAAANHTHTAAQVGAAAASHNHDAGNITSGILAIARGGLGNDSGYVRIGQRAGTTVGGNSTAEGYNTTANKWACHAEGIYTTASGTCSHAEGSNNTASGDDSHAEGASTTASGAHSHAEGANTKASGGISHAEGQGATASGSVSHAEGSDTTASGDFAHAEGRCATANGNYSHAGGSYTYAAYYAETTIGRYNTKPSNSDSLYNTIGDYFVIGKGSKEDARANIFRVSSSGIYGTAAFSSTGADYAEMFEWADGNPEGEDRAGRFVTIQGEKIRLAGPEDDYILGIVSGDPSVVGDVHDDQWRGMYLCDVFGRPLWEDVEVPDETVEEPDPEDPEQTVARVLIPAHTERRQKLNPDYDSTQTYIPRSERPEWDAVGMLGKLVAVDDGTCQVDGWCAPGEGGVATHAQTRTRYRVMARLDDTHIRVLVL